MTPEWFETGLLVVSLLMNLAIAIMSARIRADIANVKVYVHEKFLTREEFLAAMEPPTFLGRRRRAHTGEHETI